MTEVRHCRRTGTRQQDLVHGGHCGVEGCAVPNLWHRPTKLSIYICSVIR